MTETSTWLLICMFCFAIGYVAGGLTVILGNRAKRS
jgi:hypothetical protein